MQGLQSSYFVLHFKKLKAQMTVDMSEDEAKCSIEEDEVTVTIQAGID